MTRTKTNWIKYRDLVLLYDHDFVDRQRLLRARQIIEDRNTNILTPNPSVLNNRIQSNIRPRSVVGKPRGFEPRRVKTCFESNNKEVERTLINPYSANDENHNVLIKQVRDDFNPKTLSIDGESYSVDVKQIL